MKRGGCAHWHGRAARRGRRWATLRRTPAPCSRASPSLRRPRRLGRFNLNRAEFERALHRVTRGGCAHWHGRAARDALRVATETNDVRCAPCARSRVQPLLGNWDACFRAHPQPRPPRKPSRLGGSNLKRAQLPKRPRAGSRRGVAPGPAAPFSPTSSARRGSSGALRAATEPGDVRDAQRARPRVRNQIQI
jgi:hypothetical protein